MKDSTQPETTVDESARMLKLYQLLATSLADNEIFLFDQDFKIIMTEGSPRFVRLQAEENFVGKNLHELIESGKFSFLKDPVTTLFQNNSRYDSEHEIEGSFYTTAIYAAEHEPAEDKKFIGVLLIKDITALTRKQRELELLNKRIDRSNQELENFAYVASHDLHAPLRKIQSFGKLLSDRYAEALTGQGQVYLERILDSTKRMERLLDDLLSFSRSTSSDGGMVPTDLVQVLQDVLTDNNLLDQPEITLNIPTELPVIRAVPSQMQQLFQNLLDNACKFKRPDVPTVIDLRYRRATTAEIAEFELLTEGEYCVLEFADNGIGFDKENAERIFNIFQRLHGVSEYQGSGIGLAICKKVVDNHRGAIKASGVPGAGAIFTIVLPFE